MKAPRRPARVRAAVRVGGLLLLAASLGGWSFFDPFHENVEKGNEEAAGGDADEALRRYGEAARVRPGSPVPDFNRGIVLSKKGESEAARDAFLGASAAADPAVAADALYNLGNVLMDSQQLEPAVDAYLKSLDLDPDDADARRNLEIALQRLQQQQQQQQQQDQQQQDQPKDENEQDPQQQEPQENPDDSQEETPQEPQPDEDQQQDRQDQDQQEQPQPEEDRMTREDAERLLNAVQSDELRVLQQLHDQDEDQKGVVGDDW
jgi:Ca-activated chloride channel family protein